MSNQIPIELIPLFNRNTADTQNKIINSLNYSPSNSDCQGFVYGFDWLHDKNLRSNFFIKFGRTEKSDPRKRVVEWQGNTIFCLKSSYNRRLERLIHLFFRYANEHRMIDGHNQIEWFHFTEKTNVVMYVGLIHELIEDTFKFNFSSNYDQQISYAKSVDYSVKQTQSSKKSSKLVNINTFTVSELTSLLGIGPALSNRIVRYREQYGRFRCKEDIMKVPYIKEGHYSKIRELITV